MEFLSVGVSLATLVVAYITGTTLERRHLLSIVVREEVRDGMIVITYEDIPSDWVVEEAGLVIGNVVVSIDYFKRFSARLKSIVGGRLGAYEPMMERGRREAILRMKAQAAERGYQHVINVRLETACLAGGGRNGKSTAGIEVMAYGTALKLAS